MKNLPNTIYLNLGDITTEEYNESDFKQWQVKDYEITWCEDKIYSHDEEYVRLESACQWLHDNLMEVNENVINNFIVAMKEWQPL